MKNFPTLSWIKITLIIGSCLIGCSTEQTITVSFEALVASEPLEFGKTYPAPNGDGTYVINDFKLYVSGIKLKSSKQEFSEPDSYHLLVFQDTNRCTFTIPGLPKDEYHKILLSIGVDSAGNFSKGYQGDLDPTNQMAWNWTQGYKFILFEGLYTPQSTDDRIPLIYHVGFEENKKDLEFDLGDSETIRFVINLDQLFQNPQTIDFHTHPRILFNKEHAAVISSNYADSFIELKM